MKRLLLAGLLLAAHAGRAGGDEECRLPDVPLASPQLDSALDDLHAQLEPLFRKYYPKVTTCNRHRNGVRFDFGLTTYEFPYEGPRLGKHSASTRTGPKKGGIECGLSINKGRYSGQLAMWSPGQTGTLGPLIHDEEFYKTLFMAPYSEKLDAWLWVVLSYPSDVNEQFLREFVATITSFEKGKTEAKGPAPAFSSVGHVSRPIDFSFRDQKLDQTLDEIFARLQPLFNKYYPQATAANLHGNGIRFEHRLMTFELPDGQSAQAKRHGETHQGPEAGGIQCGVYLGQGRYAGQVKVLPAQPDGNLGPTTIDEKFYKVMLMVPYSARQDVYLFAALSYPPDADPQFLEEFKAILRAFEQDGQAADPEGPAGELADQALDRQQGCPRLIGNDDLRPGSIRFDVGRVPPVAQQKLHPPHAVVRRHVYAFVRPIGRLDDANPRPIDGEIGQRPITPPGVGHDPDLPLAFPRDSLAFRSKNRLQSSPFRFDAGRAKGHVRLTAAGLEDLEIIVIEMDQPQPGRRRQDHHGGPRRRRVANTSLRRPWAKPAHAPANGSIPARSARPAARPGTCRSARNAG